MLFNVLKKMSDRRASITTIHFFLLSLSLLLASEEGI